MNVELLKKVQYHILEEPRRLDMRRGIQKNASPCGTVGCIAGWTVILSGRFKPEDEEYHWFTIKVDAVAYLGISNMTRDALFYPSGWPAKFRAQYDEAGDLQGRAEVTAARIQHLIDTGE